MKGDEKMTDAKFIEYMAARRSSDAFNAGQEGFPRVAEVAREDSARLYEIAKRMSEGER